MTVTFLSPVFGVLWGVVLLREQLSWSIIVGFAIILSGTGLVTGVHLRRKRLFSHSVPLRSQVDNTSILMELHVHSFPPSVFVTQLLARGSRPVKTGFLAPDERCTHLLVAPGL